MKMVKVRLLDPRAIKLLKNLADLNLISIEYESDNGFLKVLSNLQHKRDVLSEEMNKEMQ
jgi:hypothetical protein